MTSALPAGIPPLEETSYSRDDILEDLRGIAAPEYPPPRAPGVSPAPAQPSLFDQTPDEPAPSLPPAPAEAPPQPPNLDPTQQRVWDALASRRHTDELARELELPVPKLSAVLMGLEMRRLIRRLPGNFYERR